MPFMSAQADVRVDSMSLGISGGSAAVDHARAPRAGAVPVAVSDPATTSVMRWPRPHAAGEGLAPGAVENRGRW